jgi:pyrimidine operon attenuation protein/uracil phosphoribosyltransferase
LTVEKLDELRERQLNQVKIKELKVSVFRDDTMNTKRLGSQMMEE